MKKLNLLVLLLSFSVSLNLFAAPTWIAICNDGQNIQYNQTQNGTGFLYMKVKADNGQVSTYQMARLNQSFYNGIAICGSVVGNGNTNNGGPITELCINKDRKTVYVKYHHPYEGGEVKSGVFCSANVRINQ
ncbi:MAG: hypothetical protein HQK53_11215 [Oligoflexia bacterium]|nr:hypothetical protein [Oligoflexia bacterium]